MLHHDLTVETRIGICEDDRQLRSILTRAFEAGPEGLELLVFGPRHEGDAEIVQDFSW